MVRVPKNEAKLMDTAAINKSLQLSLENKVTFLEHIRNVSEAGARGYLVDLLQDLIIYFGFNNDTHQIKLNLIFKVTDLPFSAEKVSKAILEIQAKKISYVDFLNKIYLTGIRQYNVDIPSGQVVYSSSKGEQHIEAFPTKPRNDLQCEANHF